MEKGESSSANFEVEVESAIKLMVDKVKLGGGDGAEAEAESAIKLMVDKVNLGGGDGVGAEAEAESAIKLMVDKVKLDGGDGAEAEAVIKEDEQLKSQGYQSGTTEGEGGKRATFDGTGIFPAELWEPILDRIWNSEDILNVLRAFPELDQLFQGKKAYWLFDQVLTHLMTKHLTIKTTDGDDHNWTYSRDLLRLRGVSKRWKKVVERALEDHPDRHPPSLSLFPANRKPVALPINHFNSQRMQRFHLGASLFQTCGQINQFMDSMRHLTPDQNPFPGKSVVLKPDIQWYSKSLLLLQKAEELFQKFGKHVLTLEISFWDRMNNDSNLPLCQAVLVCLSHTPNLRSLTLKGQLLGGENRTQANILFGKQESQTFFPDLPSLKTFVCQVCYEGKCSTWVKRLFKTYARERGLQKLGIQHDQYWTFSLSSSLTALTELHLFLEYDCSPNLGKIEKVLRSLPNSGNLKKFGLSYIPLLAIGNEPVDITKLIDMLAGGYFQVETLVLEHLVLMEGPPPDAFQVIWMKTLPSVTSLCLQDDKKLRYDFLKMLPNLRTLTVYMQLEDSDYTRDYEGNMDRWELQDEEDGTTEFAKTLRKYLLQTKYGILEERQDFEGLWRGLPRNLEMICGSVEQPFRNVVDVQFVREWGNQAFLGWRMTEEEEIAQDQDLHGGEREVEGEGCVVA